MGDMDAFLCDCGNAYWGNHLDRPEHSKKVGPESERTLTQMVPCYCLVVGWLVAVLARGIPIHWSPFLAMTNVYRDHSCESGTRNVALTNVPSFGLMRVAMRASIDSGVGS
jgi:hypothetical protein